MFKIHNFFSKYKKTVNFILCNFLVRTLRYFLKKFQNAESYNSIPLRGAQLSILSRRQKKTRCFLQNYSGTK